MWALRLYNGFTAFFPWPWFYCKDTLPRVPLSRAQLGELRTARAQAARVGVAEAAEAGAEEAAEEGAEAAEEGAEEGPEAEEEGAAAGMSAEAAQKYVSPRST